MEARSATPSSRFRPALCASTLCLVSACGGGGGGVSPQPTAPLPAIAISAIPAKILPGQEVVLNWSTNNATSCTAGNAWSGTRSVAGSTALGAVQTTSRYELTCTNSAGSTTATAEVTVLSPASATVVQLSPSLPAVIRMKAARVQSLLDESPVGEAVKFAWSEAGEPGVVFVEDVDGKATLAGYAGGSSTEISARSTAIVMGRLGLAAATPIDMPELEILDMISASASLDGLTAAIASSLEIDADPWESSTVVIALAGLIEAIQLDLSARGLSKGALSHDHRFDAATPTQFPGVVPVAVGTLLSGRSIRIESADVHQAVLTNRTQVSWAISSSQAEQVPGQLTTDKYVEGVGLLDLILGLIFDGWDAPHVNGTGDIRQPYFVHVRQNQKTFWDNTTAAFVNLLGAALTISGFPNPTEAPQCRGKFKETILHYVRTGLDMATTDPLAPGGSISRSQLVSLVVQFGEPFAELAYDCMISSGLQNRDFRSARSLDQFKMRLAKLNTILMALELVDAGAFYIDYFSAMGKHWSMKICFDETGNPIPCEGYAVYAFSGDLSSPMIEGTDQVTYYSQSNRPANMYTDPWRTRVGVTAAQHRFCRRPDGQWIPKSVSLTSNPETGTCPMPQGANIDGDEVPCTTTKSYSISLDSAGTFSVTSSRSSTGSKPMTDPPRYCGGSLSEERQSSITFNLSTGEASGNETRAEEYISEMSNGVNCLMDIHRIERHLRQIVGTWQVDPAEAIAAAGLQRRETVHGAVPMLCTDPAM